MSAAQAVLNHAWIRMKATARTPATLGFALFVLLEIMQFDSFLGEMREEDGSWVMMAILPLVCMLMAVLARAAVQGRGATENLVHGFYVQSCPTLPLGPRQRSTAEGIAALVLIVVTGVLAMPLTLALGTHISVETFWLGGCFALPWAFYGGYSSSAILNQNTGWHVLCVFLAIFAVQETALQLGWVDRPALLVALTAASATLVVWASGIKMSDRAGDRRSAPPRESLHRRARPGPRQLERDQVLRPLPPLLAVAGCVLLAEGLVFGLFTHGIVGSQAAVVPQPLFFLALAAVAFSPY